MTELSITVQQQPGFHVVRLEGELDRSTHPRLEQTLQELTTRTPPKIILDAAELAFCDSCGLQTLIRSQRRAEDRGGGLRLIGVHGPLARLLTITRLIDLFPPYTSLTQAAWPPPH
ncbi:STAS domain-containing protein [Nonomuraea sp. KM90]|uniref:STAS domain-containing protein n=1 Tax=Nonomuraea sp. KM90 TaxID=3457428 RepID=UPI003FCE2816